MVAGERKLVDRSIGPAAEGESAAVENDVPAIDDARNIEIALLNDPDRTLMEVLLDAAFGAQCRKSGAPISSEAYGPAPLFRSTRLPLGELFARGYAIQCKMRERREN